MSRIVSFPEPLPDEDFRSILYRYHLRSGDPEFIHTQYELFGVRSYKQKMFPRGLQIMLDRLPLGHTFTTEDLLYKHTWYGLYKAFLTDERNKKMFDVILHGSNTRNAEGQPQIAGKQSVLASEVKYCPACVLNDLQTYGEVIVHRKHQVAFLEICPVHSLRLFSECPKCFNKYGNTQTGVLLRESRCKCGYDLPNEYIEMNPMHQKQINLLNDLFYIRDNHNKFNIDTIIIKFIEQLYSQGFITPKGAILKRELLAYFKDEFLRNDIFIFDEVKMEGGFFRNTLFHREHMVNSISFYLQLAQLLCKSFRSLTETHIQYAIEIPFGNGPWACKNSKCQLYNVPRINCCSRNVNNSSGVYSIKYDCESCNHTNSIRGEKIICSKRKISKDVNNTINGINEINAARQEIAVASDVSFERKIHKNRLLMRNLLYARSFKTRSEIRKQAPYLFDWLMDHDREWLESRIPQKIERKSRKLDFKLIDQDLQRKIRIAGESISSDYHLPIRRGTVLRKLSPKNRNRFTQYHRENKLPLSVQEIDKFVESNKQFLIRSIPRHYSKLLVDDIKGVTVSYFKQRASVSYYLNGDDEVDEHIRKFLAEKGKLI